MEYFSPKFHDKEENFKCIIYHIVPKGISADEWKTTYINTKDNPSDVIWTKNLPAGTNRYRKIHMLLYDINPMKDGENDKKTM